MPNDILTSSAEWSDLVSHKRDMEDVHMRELFEEKTSRFSDFSIEYEGLLFDYSKNKIDTHTIELLCKLAEARKLGDLRDAMFSGDVINLTEKRSALHTALRYSTSKNLNIEGESVRGFVDDTLDKIKNVSRKIREDSNITDVVNIGIGGSDLGPMMVYNALKPLADGPRVHYVSNIDGQCITETLKNLDQETTLLLIVSKTFTTLETLTNARTARDWLAESVPKEQLSQHIIAVTNNTEQALEFGVTTNHIFPMRDWIGGRYSLWGSVGLSIAISHGINTFEELLNGAHLADEHFSNEPFDNNIPVLMGMLGIWYRNFWDYPAHAILPYSHDLRDLPRYLQQLDMESNGKSTDIRGHEVETNTGPIIFGAAGTNAQHAFMQLFHQGTTVIPADFVIAIKPQHHLMQHHTHLFSNALAQSKALMEGIKNIEEPHRNFEGNRPSNIFMLKELDAKRLGMLLAFYEHKIFVQGVIWGINSFDQWGVELGKAIAKNLYGAIKSKDDEILKEANLDSSTAGLIEYFRGIQEQERDAD
ncbi:MAG: glucose-6-phosphate isomerase [Micavibrio sp.]|nr:glucose-6-phosphate isomerase [Micavibrio sp.]